MARGNGRQNIVRDDIDGDRLQEQLGKAAVRCSWHVYAFAIMEKVSSWKRCQVPLIGFFAGAATWSERRLQLKRCKLKLFAAKWPSSSEDGEPSVGTVKRVMD